MCATLHAGSALESKCAPRPPAAATPTEPLTTASPAPKRVLNETELEVLQKAFKSTQEVRTFCLPVGTVYKYCTYSYNKYIFTGGLASCINH